MPKIYAFDVDECLEISNGPVTLQMMMDLRLEGHVVGICGNWGLFAMKVTGWQHLVSFMNLAPPIHIMGPDGQAIRMDKTYCLKELKTYIQADEYIMVGNILGEKNSLGHTCGSDDKGSAERAGWRFIKEDDFAKGVR